MIIGPIDEPSAETYALDEAARRLGVSEAAVREWLSTFNWERRFDGEGHLYLTARDLDFLRVVKSLKEVDRSCDSISRIIQEETITHHVIVVDQPLEPAAEEEAEPLEETALEDNREQIETLKAELKELQARPSKKPFWKFW